MPEQIDTEKSGRILTELKRRKEHKGISSVAEARIMLVIFSLGKNYYAFHGDGVKRILPYERIHFVPGCPEFIIGIINVRGDIHSVVNIHKILGFSAAEPTNRSRIVIAERGDICSGILVDSVENVIDVPESLIRPPIATLDRSIRVFVAGQSDYDNRNVTVLDVERILRKLAA